MKIQKVLSHNVVIARDPFGRECVAAGKGIGFGLRPGDPLDHDRVEKIFYPREKAMVQRFSGIIDSFPYDYFRVGDEIVRRAAECLGREISDSIYLALIEHLACAIERFHNQVVFSSLLTLEMQQFYPDEFAMGMEALDIIERRLGTRLPDDEAAFIAFHLVNAHTKASRPAPIRDSLKLLRSILNTVQNVYGVEFEQASQTYSNFIAQLRQFTMRFCGSGAAEDPAVRPPAGSVETDDACRRTLSQVARIMREDYGREPTEAQLEALARHVQQFLRGCAEEGR